MIGIAVLKTKQPYDMDNADSNRSTTMASHQLNFLSVQYDREVLGNHVAVFKENDDVCLEFNFKSWQR